MTKKIGDKKVTAVKAGDVKSADSAEQVGATDLVKGSGQVKASGEVGAVGAVKSTGGVSSTSAASGSTGKRRATTVMSFAEREQLFQMVKEEATKMFAGSGMSEEKQKMVAEAVKMAIDTGLLDENNTGDNNSGEKSRR